MTPEIHALLVAAIAACLVALIRKFKFAEWIDGPVLVWLSHSVAAVFVALALFYVPQLLALLPMPVAAAIVAALSSPVALGAVELLRSMASKVDIDQRTMASKAAGADYEMVIKVDAEDAIAKLNEITARAEAVSASAPRAEP